MICSKRRLVTFYDWLAIGRELAQCGKEVILSTLTLLEAASESGALKKLCGNDEFMVEANDMAAVQLLAAAGAPFVTGPGINIYNQRSLELLARKGLRRWVLPVELGLETLRDLQAGRPCGVETEVFALGRLPLAFSARCYTARSHNLPKDDCRFKCLDYPEGRLLKTQEGEDFLVLNGIQTQSAAIHLGLGQMDEFRTAGVDVLRISPLPDCTPDVVRLFDAARTGGDARALAGELLDLLPAGACNGYLFEHPGMDHDATRVA